MTLSSGFHMPGGFHSDGIHQGLFRPPVSPASSSGYLPPTPRRKRFRDDVRQVEHVNRQDSHRYDHDEVNNSSTVLITPAGRHVAHNGRAYTLAGQLDTPSCGPADNELLEDSIFSDADYRKALGSRRSQEHVDAAETSGPTSLYNLPHHPNHQPPGWGMLTFSTLGGVVGKVWEFCKAGAFKGFYAGGGRGFEMTPAEGVLLPDESIPYQAWNANDADDADQDQQDGHCIPGYFPASDCCNDQDATAESFIPSRASTPSAPAAKRRQIAPMDELGRNWVMVGDGERVQDSPGAVTPRRRSSYKPSPRNRNQGPSAVTGRRISLPNQRRESGRVAGASPCRASPRTTGIYTMATSPPSALEPPRPASSASFASPRSPSPTKFPSMASAIVASAASPTPATSRSHNRRRCNNAVTQHTFTHSRTHSSASTASSRGAATADDVENSPRLTAEAKQLAARRQREERDADVRITAFNKQLQDMIRQGKEALGTTVEVDGEDGGWEDY